VGHVLSCGSYYLWKLPKLPNCPMFYATEPSDLPHANDIAAADGWVAPPAPCESYHEFVAHSRTVTAACCDDGAAPCVDGLPTVCSDACAAVLLPMQRTCNDFLAVIAMQDAVATAAATCGSGHRRV
jgi:hypothetical protein